MSTKRWPIEFFTLEGYTFGSHDGAFMDTADRTALQLRFSPRKIEERSTAWLHWLLENEINACSRPGWGAS